MWLRAATIFCYVYLWPGGLPNLPGEVSSNLPWQSLDVVIVAGYLLHSQRRGPDSAGHTRMRSKKLMDSNISGNPYNMREDIIRRQVTGRATGAGKAVRVWL